MELEQLQIPLNKFQPPLVKFLLCGLGKQNTVSLTDFIFFSLSFPFFFFSLKITFNIYFPAVYKLTSSTHKSGMLCFFKLQAE